MNSKLKIALKKKKPGGGASLEQPRAANISSNQNGGARGFVFDTDDSEDDTAPARKKRALPLEDDLLMNNPAGSSRPKKKGKRWDNAGPPAAASTSTPPALAASAANEVDSLDLFMDKLQSHVGSTAETGPNLSVDLSGSMLRPQKPQQPSTTSSSNDPATALKNKNQEAYYQHEDWASDVEVDTEAEQAARRRLVDALQADVTTLAKPIETTQQLRSEQSRRDDQIARLEQQAAQAKQYYASVDAVTTTGRLYNDDETGVMEEAERVLQIAHEATPDALQVMADINKKKELKVNHAAISYAPFEKNLYLVPRSLAQLSHDDVINRRSKHKIRVRGHGTPAPVSTFAECGVSSQLLGLLDKHGMKTPFAVQAQAIPTIMAGRDVIGIAKTGSGKTLAYLLPMLRHILAQPPLEANESGPIGLILAPARELAYQIHLVCKQFARPLGLKSTAIYGGAGVAEQIADLKRGAEIVVATPGRLIDILTTGKVLSLHRVTYVTLDECDRILDMGFAPQVEAILSAIRPDRQMVLFSATFPKAIEMLARKSLKYPVEIIVGGRSVASDNITQFAELIDEQDKFLRLLQILGEHVEDTKKVIVFVDTQVRCDGLFEQLLRNGYSSLSLHGGKEQEDRDSTISDFKRKDGPNVLVATGVAGRGLDVPDCTCVVNYSAPNHLEALVHQVGRTGRAGKTGVAYTLVNSTDEAKHAPTIVRALSEAGQGDNISPELRAFAEEYRLKVEKGEARYAGSGFKGKGYTYDKDELNESQKMAKLEKRRAMIEAGLADPDEDEAVDPDATSAPDRPNGQVGESKAAAKKDPIDDIEIPANLTPELLALPGMKEALLRRAGITPAPEATATPGTAGAPEINTVGIPVQVSDNHWLAEIDINDYPREARWKVTQRDTTSRLQDEFRTAVTLKGLYFEPGKEPKEDERRLYLHLEATGENILKKTVAEIQRLLNEETLRVAAKATSGGGGSHKYNVFS